MEALRLVETLSHTGYKNFLYKDPLFTEMTQFAILSRIFFVQKKKSLHINGHKFYLLRRQTTKINYNNECYKELKN